MSAVAEPVPIPGWFRQQFVDRHTNRLSPRFFFRNNGRPRKPFLDALKRMRKEARSGDGGFNALWCFTPFMVTLAPSRHDHQAEQSAFECALPWLADNTDEPWFFFVSGSDDVIGFASHVDAVKFKLYWDWIEPRE